MKKLFYQAWVSIKSYKLYSIINIIGLAISLAFVMMLSMYINQESTVDKFHPNADKIYAVYVSFNGDKAMLFEPRARTSYWSGYHNENNEYVDLTNLPEVSMMTKMQCVQDEILINENIKYNASIINCDTLFYKVFGYPLLVGDKNTILNDPSSAILKKDYAKKLFGKKNPIGEKINIKGKLFTVAGIAGEPKGKSSFEYDIIISTLNRIDLSYKENPIGFYIIETPAKAKIVQEKIKNLHVNVGDAKFQSSWNIIQINKLYAKDNISKEQAINKGNSENVNILILVTIILLIIGIFNYVNIQSVITLKRGKELGVKKVFGASNSRMFGQFLIESSIYVSISTILGFFIAELIRPSASILFEMDIRHIWSFDTTMLISILIIVPVITALIPYLKYRYSMPIDTIKQVGSLKNRSLIRNIFTVAQYIMTNILIVVSIFFIKQLHVMVNTDKGFESKNIIISNPPSKYDLSSHIDEEIDATVEKINKDMQYMEQILDGSPAIIAWTNGNPITDKGRKNRSIKEFSYLNNTQKLDVIKVSPSYIDVFGLKLVDGKFFSKTDLSNKIILTESTKKLLGIDDITTAKISSDLVNKLIIIDGKVATFEKSYFEIIGVVKDFAPGHINSENKNIVLYTTLPPCNMADPLIIRYQPGKEKEVLSMLKKIYSESFGTDEFEYTTMENIMDEIYKYDRTTSITYGICALIAIFISSLGLFGLSLFDIQQSYREIAIRKINGATYKNIMKMLSARYYKLLLISFVIACPISWLGITKYLEGSMLKAPISWWIFALAALITAAISLGTIWWQTNKAANENPAVAMKKE